MNLRLALVVVLAAHGGGGLVLRRMEDLLLLLSLKVPHLMEDQPGLMYQQSQSRYLYQGWAVPLLSEFVVKVSHCSQLISDNKGQNLQELHTREHSSDINN